MFLKCLVVLEFFQELEELYSLVLLEKQCLLCRQCDHKFLHLGRNFSSSMNLELEILKEGCLIPKGPWVPYVEFNNYGQAAVNAINFWIF